MRPTETDRSMWCAFMVATVLWLPLLAFDLGYPSLSQVVGTPVLQRTTLAAAGVCLLVLAVLALAAAAAARRLARHPSGMPPASDVAFCGVASGSAALIGLVVVLRAFGGPATSALRDLVELTVAALAAAVIGAGIAAVATVAARGLRLGWLPLPVGLVAAGLWAVLTDALVRTTEAQPLNLWWLALGAFAVALGLRFGSRGRLAAVVLAAALAAVATAPALRWRPDHQATELPRTATATADSPHVVVVVIDTWRWDATGLARPELGTTPRLMALAADGGTVFREAVTAAPSTLPSIKAMITGRFSSQLGIPWWGRRPPPATAWTMARAFRLAGYATTGFTANALIRGDGFEAGFEDFWAVGGLDNIRRSFFLYGMAARGDYWRLVPLANALHVHKTRGDTVVDRFEKWLDRRDASRPFFAYLHVVEPHFPYRDRGHGLVPETLRAVPEPYTHIQLQRLPKGDPANATYREAPKMEEILGRYHEEVRDADRLLGRVIDALSDRGLGGDTLTVVVGDHGEEFLEHHGFGHGHDVFDEQVRVPLVVQWPRRPSFEGLPGEVTVPVSLLDVFPTLADFLELPPPPQPLLGRSLRPLLAGRADPVGIVSEMVFGDQARMTYRLGKLKGRFEFDARRLPSQSSDVRVFDVVADPEETKPLDLGDSEVAAFVEGAKIDLDRLWSAARDATVAALTAAEKPEEEGREEDEELERLRSLGYI
ncbi:MAG: sulfatase [Thermoanaerobaculia bacterium]